MSFKDQQIHILLIEDNPGDIYLMTTELKNIDIPNTLHIVVDGTHAIDFLKQSGSYEGAPKPNLIILDLNLPRIDGRDVLNFIKSSPDLNKIPLLIVSASDEDSNILDSYNPQLNIFIKKPDSLKAFHSLIHQIRDFIKNSYKRK